MAEIDTEQLLSWNTYNPIGVQLALFWLQGEPVSSQVTQSLPALQWKMGSQIQIGRTFSWELNQTGKSIQCTWQISAFGLDRGNPKATFWALHTGEQNSGQVIRFRNAVNLNNIVWESAVENNPRGQIQCYIGWDDPNLQNRIKITQTIYSDWKVNSQGAPNGGYNVIRPDEYISKNTLPFYVFQEYKSTTDMKYIVRYLGYVISPFQFYNGPRKQFTVEEYVEDWGAAVFQTNWSGRTLNVLIRFRNGQTISGLLPPKAAIAVIKKDNGNYQVGYVPYEGLPVYAGAGVAFDANLIKRNFQSFQ